MGWWLSPSIPVSSTNKTDHHDISEILMKVALHTNKTDRHDISETLLKVALHTNKTDRHDISEILLKVTLNTITLTKPLYYVIYVAN
jgi:hypothetical protein